MLTTLLLKDSGFQAREDGVPWVRKGSPDQERDERGRFAAGAATAIADLHDKFPADPVKPEARMLVVSGQKVGEFTVDEREGRLRIRDISSNVPHSGVGSLLLRRILNAADRAGVKTELTASAYGSHALDTDQLKAWYERHGFTAEPGYDPSLGYMVREPHVKKDSPGLSDVHVDAPLGHGDKDEDEEMPPGSPHAPVTDLRKRISGSSDISLNAEGRRLARELGERVHARGCLDILHCSPLPRAEETGEAILDACPNTVHAKPAPELQPWHLGAFEGRMPHDVRDEIDDFIKHPDRVPPGKGLDGEPAESFNRAKARQLRYLKRVYDDFTADPVLKIGVVMHSRGMELLQAWVDDGCPDDLDVDEDALLDPDDVPHASMLRWHKDEIREIDLADDDPLKPGVYLILHSLTDDDGDDGNEELEKAFNPDQPRDDHGKFAGGGSGTKNLAAPLRDKVAENFQDEKWASGYCASFVCALSAKLDEEKIPHQIYSNADHVFVTVNNVPIDAGGHIPSAFHAKNSEIKARGSELRTEMTRRNFIVWDKQMNEAGRKLAGKVFPLPVAKSFNPDQPRDDHGKFADTGALPDKPGTTPIPGDHVRLYHQTTEANALRIAREGIKLASARGIEGPKAVWADELGFYGKPGDIPSVEFHVPAEEWAKTKPYLTRDIKPEEITAVHLPWHGHARYILSHPDLVEQARAGKLGSFGSPEWDNAIRYVKETAGKRYLPPAEVYQAARKALDAGVTSPVTRLLTDGQGLTVAQVLDVAAHVDKSGSDDAWGGPLAGRWALRVLRKIGRDEDVVKAGGGVIVALMLDPGAAGRLAVPGGEDQGDLHVTLLHLGKLAELPLDKVAALEDALRSFAASHAPVTGVAAGPVRLHGADGDVFAATFESPDVQELRRELCAAVEAAGLTVSKAEVVKYSDDEQRDEHGRWSGGGAEQLTLWTPLRTTPEEREQRLAQPAPHVGKTLDGVSSAQLVTFSDGSKGVFKAGDDEQPQLREDMSDNYQTEREVGAWTVAKIVGMDDMVGAAVPADLGGREGVMLEYRPGEPAAVLAAQPSAFVLGAQDRVDAIRAKVYDGERDSARAALFDFVVGNEDRHAGNWLIAERDGADKLQLIDHGLTFPDKTPWEEGVVSYDPLAFNNMFLTHQVVAHGQDKVPADLAKPYIENREKILASLRPLLPSTAVAAVDLRINSLTDKTWAKLANSNYRSEDHVEKPYGELPSEEDLRGLVVTTPEGDDQSSRPVTPRSRTRAS